VELASKIKVFSKISISFIKKATKLGI